VIVIRGARQYGDYQGCLHSFRFQFLAPNRRWWQQTEEEEEVPPAVIALDALVNSGQKQWQRTSLLRDLHKAYLGFTGFATISTGNWGCGVFGGDPLLKFLQQLMAASAAGTTHLFYSTFQNPHLLQEASALYQSLTQRGASVADVWTLITNFAASEQCLSGGFDEYLRSELGISSGGKCTMV
jgi:poly(ADP-ribose) glycohydrolase